MKRCCKNCNYCGIVQKSCKDKTYICGYNRYEQIMQPTDVCDNWSLDFSPIVIIIFGLAIISYFFI